MFFARIRPVWLFLLFFVPVAASGLLAFFAENNPVNHYRFLVLSLNLSTFFAMAFVCWIATLVYVLAPSFYSKLLVFAGLALSVLFRFWQDNFNMGALHANGKIPTLEGIPLNSPIFILHALVSLIMLVLLVFLPLWLLKKEKLSGAEKESTFKTILWFFVFPIGIFFIQPRVQKILNEK
jgi:hypothetical protein